MNRYIRLLFIFLLVAVGCLYADAASPSDPKNPPKTIKVVMDNNYPPYVFLDGKGNLQGILIDQWRLWELKTGIKADISGMDWGKALSRMGAGEFDVIDTIFFNERRAQIYDFTKPYAKLDVSIFFHKNISGISDADSLQGFVVAVKSGDNAIDHLRGKGISLFQEYPSYEAIIRAAKEQKVMVTVIDNPPALYFLYKMGILDQFRYSAPLYTGEFHRAVKKGNTAILKSVEEGFSQISESEYQAINRKWFGTETSVFHPYLRHIGTGLGALIVIVLFLIVWNRTLRKKVRERTMRLEEEIALNIKKTEALQESEEKYRELVENANSIILRMDKEGRITFFNEFAQRFFGFLKEDIIGRNVVGTIVPEQETTGRDLVAMIADIGRNPDMYVTNENENMRSNGERVWIAWTNKPIFDQNGDVSEILCVGNDITERKRLEAQLIQSQKMEAIGTLAGGIAHDFNNLLMGIQGYASIMMLELDTSHPNYERLKRIEEQVQSAADLTKQLLGFARGGRYEMPSLNINNILRKSSSMFGRTKKELTIHGKYEKDLAAVEADQGQIEQVLLNLYVNAWHAMPTGGELYLETKNVTLDENYTALHGVPSGNYVKISVTDTGVGMDEKTRKRIFDPFFTTKEMGRGTGLGLAMAYGIMKGHKGFINVYGEPGHGTTFTLYLPASEKKALEEKPAAPDVLRGTETILLVDDEPSVLAVSKEILESFGYTVHGMRSGQEAIAFYKEKKDDISLIILDMIMPGLSGNETFDRIRELNPSARIILSSGYSLNGQAQQIMNKGCHGFIQKPFSIAHISRKIREVLEK
ncbi:MAG: transporter substrate-binding domain-containing protein [Proteobacteria bacterium]|nr:transporter substrate-binding domain-containing protein [Pseudomonadota bacterium]